jgi:hypothetical protein
VDEVIITAAIGLDEAIAFALAEPLDGAGVAVASLTD